MQSFIASHASTQLLNADQQAVILLHNQQIMTFNDAAGKLFHASPEQLAKIHHPAQLSPLQQPCGSSSFDKAEQMLAKAIEQGQHQFHWLHQRMNGEPFYARVTLTIVAEAEQEILCAVVQDLSIETRNMLNMALGRLMFSKSHDAIMITDRDNRIVDVNPAFCRITGYQRPEVIGLPAGFMRSGVHDQQFYAHLWQQLNQYGCWEGEIWDKHRQGHLFPKDLKICSVADPDGYVMNYLALFSDISEKLNHKLELEKLAYYDALTGLPNRTLLLETLERNVTRLKLQNSDQQLALALIDIDNFKAINDTRGHLFGDQLIKAVTHRIASLLSADDFLGRMSGDEFLLIFRPQPQLSAIEQLLSRIIDFSLEPFAIDDIRQQVSVTIGIGVYPKDGTDSKSLIAKADIAMYHAKHRGGNQFLFYSAEVGAQFFEKSDIELHLADAIRKGDIFPKFQPKIDLHQGTVIGGEILARWQRANGEFIPPDKFIAIAEQQHQIQALSASLIWQSSALAGNHVRAHSLTLAFNVSVQELLEPKFSQQFSATLAKCGLSPEHCEIEITESCLIENFAQAKSCVDELRQLGIKVAIDDFGTGFCSLNYLRSLAVDTIKLDRSFVGELDVDNLNNMIVVKAIIDLAHQLGIKVLAEGVETQTQLAILKALQCDEVQGFYFSPALAWQDFCQFASQFNAEDICRLNKIPLPPDIAALLQKNAQ
ncbi:EAL domain-containing protein [Rheinheimera muenzenbergensis]|uniref:EAL domain-containing protein n=1 Tax=Rheinheimera muenzenbergensis TaxID=1193628 RepID=A0ABU8C1I5_9GAMM